MLPLISLEELLNAASQPSARLELHRLELLRSHIPQLHQATLTLDLEYHLLIICHSQQEAEAVLGALDAPYQVWLTLGCWSFSVWLEGDCLKRCVTHALPTELESDAAALEDSSMATATLEKSAVQANGAAAKATEAYYPLEAIAKNLAAYTKQPIQETINTILAARPDLRFEDGIYKAPASAGREAFRLWAAEMEMQLAAGLLPEVADTPAIAPEPAKPAAKTTRKPAAKKTTAKKTTTRKPAARAKEQEAEQPANA